MTVTVCDREPNCRIEKAAPPFPGGAANPLEPQSFRGLF
jgi:hypothetical protein